MRNIKKRGQFTIFVYREKPNRYIGVCLEFDLIEEGGNPKEVMERVKEASIGYLRTVIDNKLSDGLLNKKPPKRYLGKYQEFLELKRKKTSIPWEEFLRTCLYPQIFQEKCNV